MRTLNAALLSALLLWFLVPSRGEGEPADLSRVSIIPRPVRVEPLPGFLSLPARISAVVPEEYGKEWEEALQLFSAKAQDRFGISAEILKIKAGQGSSSPGEGKISWCRGSILIGEAVGLCGFSRVLPEGDYPDEGYKLAVDKSVLVEARTPAGLYYALMTLLQMLESAGPSRALPKVKILDYPRFPWRGLLLDPARSFLPLDVVKRYIDLMSELKLNRLHFHLVDDQGWRVESKLYPRLTEVGGVVDNMSKKKLKALAEVKYDEKGRRTPGGRYRSVDEAARSRGYYTQEELKELVEFARTRQVMVVPEIDVPGHSTAMIAAYPWLHCSGEPLELGKVGKLYRNALCPGKEEVYEFLDRLFGELAEIFPAPYVHIGSDEVWTTKWMEAPENQWLIEKYGFTDNAGLQSYFVDRVSEILAKHGRTMIAWDEITDYAPERAIIQAWRRHSYARKAAERGNDSIVSPTSHCYIDYPQLRFTLKNLYLFEPIPEGLAPNLHHRILGGEVNLWGEWVTLENMDKKIFPRLFAHAEVMWASPEQKDWEDFAARLSALKKNWEARGIEFGLTWRELSGRL